MSNENFLINNQRLLNIGLLGNATEQIKQNTALREQAISNDNNKIETKQEREAREDLEIENISLQNEVNFYKDLLSKPMYIIAHHNEDFKKSYELQQELLAEWMVSQRAFKELAIDFGLKLDKEKNEIVDMGMKKRIDVLDNKTQHGNDLGDDFYVKPFIEKIKNKK